MKAIFAAAAFMLMMVVPALAATVTYQFEDGIAEKGNCTLGPATLSQDANGDPLARAPYTCPANSGGGQQTRILTLSLMTLASGNNFNVYEEAQVTVNANVAQSGTLQVGPNTSCGPAGASTAHYVGLKVKFEGHGTDKDRTTGAPLFVQNCT